MTQMSGRIGRLILRGARWVCIYFLCLSNSAAWQGNSSSKVESSPWPEADQIFRSDPRWLGGDAAFSVDLGDGRVLWMFGDSFVAKKAGETRMQAAFIRNSVAIQTGYDPSRAAIKFYSATRHNEPGDFMPSKGTTWLWPLHGIRLRDRLLLLYMRMARDPNKSSLGFQSLGWNAFMVDNPDAEPSKWKPRKLDGPETQGKMLVGMSVIRDDEFVYAFVLHDVEHHAYLLRWPVGEAMAGRLSSPQWWCGSVEGWRENSAHRQVVIRDAGSDFSVQRDPRGEGFLEVNTDGFGATNIVFRRAARLEGAWSEPQKLYRPPESAAPNAFVYGGKAHPELSGGDLIVTYTVNGSDERLAHDMSIYFPRFVRVTFSEDSTGGQPRMQH
ncbi:conserved hypothetical protein [Candidatus Sulfotelmatobacter kueseliae]|uniref:DUF4185 domain-containing protein n=1 Tax=Candidatus Sulfotelmatobacter kueseliae TaxID=2042962 RepID=A0A2U3KVK6_9BACT|nr:conserved hypothetical protein [Candidatus Sulfotelmatobacter kueseliae]